MRVQDFLTEGALGAFLKNLSNDWVHDFVVPESGLKNRPDYRSEKLKLIVEFNGHFHYTVPNTILSDEKKRLAYITLGYKIIEIPYFLQLDSRITKFLFGLPKGFNSFPHGFISKNLVLPASFCSLGVQRFYKELTNFPLEVAKEIIQSLENRPELKKDRRLVYPLSFELQGAFS